MRLTLEMRMLGVHIPRQVNLVVTRYSWLAVFLLTVISLFAEPSWARLERTEMYGYEYVKLRDWANLYKWKMEWTRKDEEVTVTGKWSRLVCTVNSKQTDINGICTYLSVPIARRGDEAYVSVMDIKTTLQPLFYPQKPFKTSYIRTVCLDPGHGGRDPGNMEGSYTEKRFTLLLAQEVQKQLKAAGIKVVMTRTSDEYHHPEERPDIASKLRPDIYVSLHFNAFSDKSIRGIETYCLTPAYASSTNGRGEGANTGAYDANKHDERNVQLAWQVQKAMIRKLDATDRGVRRARFAVLKLATVPAILIEAGYMSHPVEGQSIYSISYRRKLAGAIVDGIKGYKKWIEPTRLALMSEEPSVDTVAQLAGTEMVDSKDGGERAPSKPAKN